MSRHQDETVTITIRPHLRRDRALLERLADPDHAWEAWYFSVTAMVTPLDIPDDIGIRTKMSLQHERILPGLFDGRWIGRCTVSAPRWAWEVLGWDPRKIGGGVA